VGIAQLVGQCIIYGGVGVRTPNTSLIHLIWWILATIGQKNKKITIVKIKKE